MSESIRLIPKNLKILRKVNLMMMSYTDHQFNAQNLVENEHSMHG